MYRLNEIGDTPKGQYALGQVYARANKRRSGITDAWTKQMPKKEYYTAAEYYPKGTKKYDDIMHDAKSEAECPPNRKVNMKSVVYNDKGYETTNFGLGIMDYEKSHKTNESKQYTNMNKKLIRLTESDLHRIVKESVNKILNENSLFDPPFYTGGREPNWPKRYETPREMFIELSKYGKVHSDREKTYDILVPRKGINIEELKNYLDKKYQDYEFILTDYVIPPSTFDGLAICPKNV